MKYISQAYFYIFMIALFFSGQILAQTPKLLENVEIYGKERDFGQICPPDFESTQEVINRYLDSRYPSIFIRPDGLSVLVDLPELTKADFILLKDDTDRDVCAVLNEIYTEQWERFISFHPAYEPMFLYDISYYAVNDHYLVIRAGGTIIVPPPEGEDRELFYIDAMLYEGIIIHDRELNRLDKLEIERQVKERLAIQVKDRDN